MNKIRLTIALTAVSALGACTSTTISNYESAIADQQAKLPSNWKVSSQAAFEPQAWQTLFDDALLSDYLTRAQQQNLDLRQAEARVRQAEASLRQSRALLGPRLAADFSASGFADLSETSDTSDSGRIGLTASWDPDIFGINRSTVRQAEARYRLQQAASDRLRRITLAQTASA